MDDRRKIERRDETVDLGRYAAALRPHWWKIVGFSAAVGVATLLALFLLPNIYTSSATITPPKDEKKQNAAFGLLSSIGLDIGGATEVEDLEVLFRSDDLTARVFGKYDLWAIVFPERFDPKTGLLEPGWIDRVFRRRNSEPPGDWDAIEIAEDRLFVRANKNQGTVTISFESPSPQGSADIVSHYLEEARSRLQEEALGRANRNKRFIQEQIGRTPDPLTLDRLYALYGQEVEREMLARNRDQFGFRVIDSPRVPKRKSKPHRGLDAILLAFLSLLAGSVFVVVRGIGGVETFRDSEPPETA